MQPTNYLRTAVILSALHISTMCTSKPVILGAGGKDGNNEQRKTQVLSRGTLVDNELPVEINLESAPRAATAPIPVSTVPTASLSRIVHGEEIKTPALTPVSKKEPPKQLSVQHTS